MCLKSWLAFWQPGNWPFLQRCNQPLKPWEIFIFYSWSFVTCLQLVCNPFSWTVCTGTLFSWQNAPQWTESDLCILILQLMSFDELRPGGAFPVTVGLASITAFPYSVSVSRVCRSKLKSGKQTRGEPSSNATWKGGNGGSLLWGVPDLRIEVGKTESRPESWASVVLMRIWFLASWFIFRMASKVLHKNKKQSSLILPWLGWMMRPASGNVN